MKNKKVVTSALGLLLLVAMAGAGHPVSNVGITATASARQSVPRIFSARLEGKKLIVEGQNFAPGALIFVDGKKRKTNNDPESPASTLISKKAAKKMPEDEIVRLQVENPDGQVSDDFGFFSGVVANFQSTQEGIQLVVGQRVLIDFNDPVISWSFFSFPDPEIMELIYPNEEVWEVPHIPTAQALFQARRKGSTSIEIRGERLVVGGERFSWVVSFAVKRKPMQ
ncbi:MAG: hypothetical protein MN733_23025 [Nitrososphaera sp.]|nr:hypothetical protein [Blastocatellia bacterium]MCI0561370.1 hypothetical protein [Nitrososphaera sp.]